MKIIEIKAFTLIELAIVLAVMAIVGAAVLPSFFATTDRARLKSDVQSARVLQSAIDLYNAEQITPLARENVADDIEVLTTNGYLPKDAVVIQTPGARWVYDGGVVKVDILNASAEIREIGLTLEAHERALLIS